MRRGIIGTIEQSCLGGMLRLVVVCRGSSWVR